MLDVENVCQVLDFAQLVRNEELKNECVKVGSLNILNI
jgi:hypothetical protein